MSSKPAILVLCTGNSCRSHMAEGFLRVAVGDAADVFSAGSKPAGYVHPLSIKVMSEAGVDISAHTSKHMNEFLPRRIDVVITVCGNAAGEACPLFNGAPIAPAGQYRVTVNTFLADGGDGFSVLRDGTDRVGGVVDTDCRVFGGRSPLSLADTDCGVRMVQALLGRIGHGVAA